MNFLQFSIHFINFFTLYVCILQNADGIPLHSYNTLWYCQNSYRIFSIFCSELLWKREENGYFPKINVFMKFTYLTPDYFNLLFKSTKHLNNINFKMTNFIVLTSQFLSNSIFFQHTIVLWLTLWRGSFLEYIYGYLMSVVESN